LPTCARASGGGWKGGTIEQRKGGRGTRGRRTKHSPFVLGKKAHRGRTNRVSDKWRRRKFEKRGV